MACLNMAKNFQELRAGMSDQAKAASAAERNRLVEEMSLYQLRKARELTRQRSPGNYIWDRAMFQNWSGVRTCM